MNNALIKAVRDNTESWADIIDRMTNEKRARLRKVAELKREAALLEDHKDELPDMTQFIKAEQAAAAAALVKLEQAVFAWTQEDDNKLKHLMAMSSLAHFKYSQSIDQALHGPGAMARDVYDLAAAMVYTKQLAAPSDRFINPLDPDSRINNMVKWAEGVTVPSIREHLNTYKEAMDAIGSIEVFLATHNGFGGF